ncbi:MAG: hypothetical protein AABO58_02580 [Acidobacteriota bacterium]
MKGLIKLIVVVVIVLLIWKKGVPWWEARRGSAAKTTASAGQSCVELAETASNDWGSGIGRFANPPYDLTAWGEFRTRTDAAIARAQSQCACDQESCRKARQAMGDLRTLVSELDSSIRVGTPPPDGLVQRQEQIDNTINAARDAVRGGT